MLRDVCFCLLRHLVHVVAGVKAVRPAQPTQAGGVAAAGAASPLVAANVRVVGRVDLAVLGRLSVL